MIRQDRMGSGMLNVSEVVTCCRLSLMLMGAGGRDGPRLAQVNLATLFVRDGDFLYDLAREIAKEMQWGGVSDVYAELHRNNRVSDGENVAMRKLRSDAIAVASDVVDVMRHLEKVRSDRWEYWKILMKKQTLRRVMREVSKSDRAVARSALSWCGDRFEELVGTERLEILLTLRRALA